MEQDAVNTRILDAAAEEFGANGFEGARVDRIAARAGVNKATLYYRIGEKDRLYAAVFGRMFDEVIRTLQEAITTQSDAEGRIRMVARIIVRTAKKHPYFPPLILREVASGGAALPDEALGRIAEVMSAIARVIEQGIRDGQLRRVDPVIAHMLLVGSLFFLISATPARKRIRAALPKGIVPATEPSEDELIDEIATIFLRGISSPTPVKKRAGGRHARKA